MSAIQMTCQRCGSKYIGGMVGSTPWPRHLCKDAAYAEHAQDPEYIEASIAAQRAAFAEGGF